MDIPASFGNRINIVNGQPDEPVVMNVYNGPQLLARVEMTKEQAYQLSDALEAAALVTTRRS
ncbi:MAG TPA: hypothetical protein VF708_19775 [Pyrinomonadaceae bacterium]